MGNLSIGAYFTEPNPVEPGHCFIYKLPHDFQCECGDDDAEGIMHALAMSDRLRRDAPQLWQHLHDADAGSAAAPEGLAA